MTVEIKPKDVGAEGSSVILVSDNGTKWKLIVDDEGILTTEEL